jgi:hypothetical protein
MNTPKSTQSPNTPFSKCANPACHCKVSPDEKYCCEHCESEMDKDTCGCGHAECEAYTERRP